MRRCFYVGDSEADCYVLVYRMLRLASPVTLCSCLGRRERRGGRVLVLYMSLFTSMSRDDFSNFS